MFGGTPPVGTPVEMPLATPATGTPATGRTPGNQVVAAPPTGGTPVAAGPRLDAPAGGDSTATAAPIAGPASAAPLALPSTGVDSAGMLAVGTGLAMVGLVAAFAGRRRRATT